MASHASQRLPSFCGGQEGAQCFPPWCWLEVLADVWLVIALHHAPAPAAGGARWPGDVPSLGSISCRHCWRDSRSLAGPVLCAAGALLLSLCPISPEDKPENVIFDPDPCALGGCEHRVLGWSSHSRKLMAAKNSASHPSWLRSENPREYVGPRASFVSPLIPI